MNAGTTEGRSDWPSEGHRNIAMCDERERLIGYVYDECDGAERRVIEAHLSECEVCRAEIHGLRSVRQDLLAWDVPETGSVFRPFAPPRPVPSWRDIPAWSLAAAAAAVFMAGAAGGATTRLWMQPAVTTVASAAPQAPAAQQPAAVGLSGDQMAALKASILRDMRAEMDSRLVAAMAAHEPTGPRVVPAAASPAAVRAMQTRLAELEEWQRDQINLNYVLDRKLQTLSNRTISVNNQLERNSQALLRAVGFQGQ